MKYSSTLISAIKISVLVLTILAGAHYLQAFGPTCAPPNCNVDAPINASSTAQEKVGALTVKQSFWISGFAQDGSTPLTSSLIIQNGRMLLGTTTSVTSLKGIVDGNLGARQFCDTLGTTCVTASTMASSSIPAGAVMAFDSATCPVGWTAFSAAAGRNIIGAGSGTGLTTRTYAAGPYATGGNETHQLTIAELPRHRFTISTNRDASSGDGAISTVDPAANASRYTNYIGSDQPHNIMDPYIVLTYCKKS